MQNNNNRRKKSKFQFSISFEFEKFEIENRFRNPQIQVKKNLKGSFVKMFSFKTIIASRVYFVYKETWSNAKLNEEVRVELETYAK